jgi:apolipoprotein N-acyltransferase
MNLRTPALAAASGLLLAAAFPTANISLLAWVALVPLLLAVRDQPVKNAFWLGGLMGIVFFAGTVHWVTNSVHFYGGIPIIPASLTTLLLCAYLALYPALFSGAAALLGRNHPSLFCIASPAIWTALELARTHVFSGFPWALIGYSQYRSLPLIQISDITGVYGVSFLIVLVNTAIAEFIKDRKQYRVIIIAALIMAFVVGYGFARLNSPEGPGTITISVIQGNIEQDKKWDPTYQAETIAVYEGLSREALKQRPDLVIWPETATPFYFNGNNPADRAQSSDLTHFVKSCNVPLLFGSPTYQVKSLRTVALHNSAFLLSGEGKILDQYNKMHLVPFGEYVPLKSVLFFIEKMVQAIGDFEPGEHYAVMTVPAGPTPRRDVKLSTVICYEIIFPDLVRKFVDHGAEVLTTITNDAWFGRTAAPHQHFSMAVFRAVENRVPLARAANTGISGFIDAKGHILIASDIFKEAYLTKTLVPGSTKTFYTRFGDLFSYACVFFSIVLLAIIPKKSGRRFPPQGPKT